MTRILTSHDIRVMRRNLIDSGIYCRVSTVLGRDAICLLLRDYRSYVPAGHSWLDVACHVIRDSVDGISMRYAGETNDNLSVLVVGFGDDVNRSLEDAMRRCC